ncbi:MAG: hypothetical protein GY711_06580 [bacterium]|nr:hypothetical protein [bacterium]
MPAARLFVAILALFCTGLSTGPALGVQTDAGAREWNQHRGNAASTSASPLAPIRVEPVEAWRAELGERLAGPVVWGDYVYAVRAIPRNRELVAFRVADGKRVGGVKIGKGGSPELCVWAGTVVVVDPDMLRTYRLQGTRLKMAKRLRGTGFGRACVAGGYAFVAAGNEVHCVDLAYGKLMASGSGAGGRPIALPGPRGRLRIATAGAGDQPGYVGIYLLVKTTTFTGVGTREVQASGGATSYSGMLNSSTRVRDAEAVLITAQDSDPIFFATSSATLKTGPGGPKARGAIMAESGAVSTLSTIGRGAAVFEDEVYGFDGEGTLIRQMQDGRYVAVVEKSELPRGARPAPLTIASGVAYIGNWAVELSSGRVFWCRSDLDNEGALWPVADGRALYLSKKGELVCLADPNAGAASAAAAGAAGPRAAVSAPGDGDGVVLRDGRRLAGKVEAQAGGRYRVAAGEGESAVFELADLALVETAGEAKLVGEPYPVFVAWRAALADDVATALADLFEGYLRVRLVADCQRILLEAREYGLSAKRTSELERKLVGKTQNQGSNASKQRARLQREEQAAREKLVQRYAAASDWCRELELGRVASVLLARSEKVLPNQAEVRERAAKLVPSAFPWKSKSDAAELWLRWSEELLPAGAEFLATDDPAWARASAPPWKGAAIGLATRNVLFFSLESDPTVVGACLRNGEGTVRTLQDLIGEALLADKERLEVRLHATRKAYLVEQRPDGGYAMPWSAGYYSPNEGVSRFYVPRDGESTEPLGRGLYEVLAHELTHHYISQRWLGKRTRMGRADQPGFWIVEGFARFVEDQAVELGRLGGDLDDTTVGSLDAVSQLAAKNTLIPAGQLVDLSQLGFAQLSDDAVARVQLRNTLVTLTLSQRSLFYEQSGSLVFFLMHRRGPEGRTAVLEYLKAFYTNRVKRKGWEALGFASAEELDEEFRAFLASVRG